LSNLKTLKGNKNIDFGFDRLVVKNTISA